MGVGGTETSGIPTRRLECGEVEGSSRHLSRPLHDAVHGELAIGHTGGTDTNVARASPIACGRTAERF